MKGNKVKSIRTSYNSHAHTRILITINTTWNDHMLNSPLQATTRQWAPNKSSHQGLHPKLCKILQCKSWLHVVSPGATPALSGEISADYLVGTTRRQAPCTPGSLFWHLSPSGTFHTARHQAFQWPLFLPLSLGGLPCAVGAILVALLLLVF